MKPNIGISETNLKRSTHLLSAMLANEMILYVKTRKSHWSVSGESFMELHKLFESQYNQLELLIDEIAERIGKLGGKTIGTMNEFLKFSFITGDFFTRLMEQHETTSWILRRYLN